MNKMSMGNKSMTGNKSSRRSSVADEAAQPVARSDVLQPQGVHHNTLVAVMRLPVVPEPACYYHHRPHQKDGSKTMVFSVAVAAGIAVAADTSVAVAAGNLVQTTWNTSRRPSKRSTLLERCTSITFEHAWFRLSFTYSSENTLSSNDFSL